MHRQVLARAGVARGRGLRGLGGAAPPPGRALAEGLGHGTPGLPGAVHDLHRVDPHALVRDAAVGLQVEQDHHVLAHGLERHRDRTLAQRHLGLINLVLVTLDGEGGIQGWSFAKTIVRSLARLSYTQVLPILQEEDAEG